MAGERKGQEAEGLTGKKESGRRRNIWIRQGKIVPIPKEKQSRRRLVPQAKPQETPC